MNKDQLKELCLKKRLHSFEGWYHAIRLVQSDSCKHETMKSNQCQNCRKFFSKKIYCLIKDVQSLNSDTIDEIASRKA